MMIEESQVIDLLDLRISELENKVFGTADVNDKTNVCDSLIHASSLISSAVSGREKISTVMRRIDELEKYLDPVYEEQRSFDIAAKTELILVMEPMLHQNIHLLERLKEMMPVVDSDEIRSVPTLSERIEKLALAKLEEKKHVDKVSQQVREMFQEYSRVIQDLAATLSQWDDIITQCEIAAQPKIEVE